jgi:hypothetical protein
MGNNIKMDIEEIECKGLNWIHKSRDMHKRLALVTTVMNIRAP